MNEIINTNKGIRDGTDMIFDNKSNNGNDLSSDIILLSNLTVYETTEWKEEKVNGSVEIMPEDWTSFKFNKFIENCSEGGTPPTNNLSYYDNGNIKWVTIKDIKKHIYDTEVKITDLGFKNSSAKMWDINDIILSTGATIGEVGIAKTKLCTKQGITGIKVNKNNNYKYIYYLLKHNTFILKKQSSGSTFLALTQKNLKLIDFILPELSEQNKIRTLLTKQDNIIENIDKRIEKTKKIIKYYQQELLSGRLRLREVETINGKEIVVYENSEWKEEKVNGRVEVIPEDWYIDSLTNISTFRRGAFPQPYGMDYWFDDKNGKPFIQVCDIENDKIKEKTKKRISLKAEPYSLKVLPGTIILTIQGSIGKIAMVQQESYVDRTLLIFQSIKNNINIKYFFINIKRLFKIEEKKADGGVIKSINKEKLSKFKIKLPVSINEQILIRDFLTKLDDNLENLQNLKNKEEKTFKFLQQEFLSGKLRLK